MQVFRSARVVLPDGERRAAIHVSDGRIAAATGFDDVPPGAALIDAGSLVISPGLVDTHVHVNEPGRTDWEGFDSATRAAAAGGVTTVIDMPLNSVPATIDVPSLERKRTAARGKCHVDVGFWGGVVPGNTAGLAALIAAGVRGFKCFLTPSGVDEFPCVDEAALREALGTLARIQPVPLLVHAELPGLLCPAGEAEGGRAEARANPRAYSTYLATRPEGAEIEAIRLLARLAAEYAVSIHVVHLSSAGGVAAVAAAQARGVPITAETCPHYLTWSAEDIPDGAPAYKCAPPIRSGDHREALWAGLRQRTCGMVVTDHSPAPPESKCLESGDFLAAWGGIASLELSLAAVWTAAAARDFSLVDLARWMSAAPAALCGLSGRKGAIVAGCDADLIVWDPDAAFTVGASRLQQRHKITPYAGRRMRGVVRSTFLRGVRVWHEGRLDHECQGLLL